MAKEKQLSNLRGYLEVQSAHPPRSEDGYLALGGCLLTPAAVAGSFFFLNEAMRWLPALIISFGVIMPIMFGLTHKFAKMMGSPRNAEEAAHTERHKIVLQWKALDAKSKLTKELDPVAGQLLEAGSFYWKKIADTMATPAWQKEDLPAHWKSLRDQSLAVSNAAMNELFMLLKDCTGKPSKTRKGDFQGAFENLTDLNFMDAALGLLTAATADASIYTFQSPYLPAVFEPARQLAEKLRDLSNEIVELTKDVHSHVASVPGAVTSASSIDLILEEMKSVRQAEKELRDEEPPQQHIQH